MSATITITGANGFLGRALCKEALSNGFVVRAVSRNYYYSSILGQSFCVPSIDRLTSWHETIAGSDFVIHCASRVHIAGKDKAEAVAEYREVNVEGTLNLARQAAVLGVRRFIFISSIGVNGGETHDKPFTADGDAAPSTPYAISKYEAELQLQELSAKTGMEFVIIRPPLIYGPNAPGNFGLLMRWLRRGIPLPLGSIHNQRSFIGRGNLVDLIMRSMTHHSAANQVFLASDGEDLSTTEFLVRLTNAFGRTSNLFPFPPKLLSCSAHLLGRSLLAQSLLGSLQVDIAKTCQLLDWKPIITVDEGLRMATSLEV